MPLPSNSKPKRFHRHARFDGLKGASAIALALCSAAPAYAQEAGKLEEIIVTAQKRSENLQDVPVAVSAFSSADLDRAGVSNASELTKAVSSLNLIFNSNIVEPFVRGVGNPQGATIGNENSVAVYVDGVYFVRATAPTLELANVERIEVLKGPQGTLFGRNSSGGLLNIFTTDPSLTKPELKITAGAARFGVFSGKFYGSVPLSDKIAFGLSTTGQWQTDGWGKNLTTGKDSGLNRYISVRPKLLFQPSPGTKVVLAGFYTRGYISQGMQTVTYRGRVAGTPALYGPIQPVVAPPNFYDYYGGINNHSTSESYGFSAHIDQDIGFADLVSISAYRHTDETLIANGTHDGFDFLNYELITTGRQFTQELQLKSKPDSPFDWIVGAYYLHSNEAYDPTRITGDAFGIGTGNRQELYGRQKINSLSGFSQATFHVIPDGTNITLGLRYTSDKVHGIGRQLFITPTTTTTSGLYNKEFTFNKLTYKVALDHKFTDDVMGYVSFSRGFKSGTFNTIPLSTDPARPETVQAYEIGIKSELFDRRVRFNSSVFQNDIQDPQVTTIVNTGTGASFLALTNAESAKSRGFEASIEALVTDDLTLRFDGTYLDAKYTRFDNAPHVFPVSALPQNGGTCPGVRATDPPRPATTGGGCPLVVRDGAGHRMVITSKWRFNTGFTYVLKTGAGNFDFDTNLAYIGRFPWDAGNLTWQKSYILLDASIAWEPADNENWRVRVWGKNLTKEKYYTVQLSNSGNAGNVGGVGAPLTFGAEVSYKF